MNRGGLRVGRIALFVSAAWAVVVAHPAARGVLQFDTVTPGVEYAVTSDRSLIDGAGPIAVHALRIDPSKTRTSVALADARTPALERVLDIATRTGAIAAVNAGFFLPSGAPAGVLATKRSLLGLGASQRAALGVTDGPHGQRFLVGRVRAFWLPWSQWGQPWPAAWFAPSDGAAIAPWQEAHDVVGGAGLLVSGGDAVSDWSEERLRGGFTTERHPRTMAGVDGEGFLWLLAIDGRHPEHSIGMTFADLVDLALAHGLRDAVNLDGGGSTTMVVQGRIVNRPSDLTGPRAVSDALVIRPR